MDIRKEMGLYGKGDDWTDEETFALFLPGHTQLKLVPVYSIKYNIHSSIEVRSS